MFLKYIIENNVSSLYCIDIVCINYVNQKYLKQLFFGHVLEESNMINDIIPITS